MKIGNYIKYLCYSDGHLIIGPIQNILENKFYVVLADDGCTDLLPIQEILGVATDEEAMLWKLENA